MNKEKKKDEKIITVFILIIIVIPFLTVIILKPSGESMITFSHLIYGLVLTFIGAIGIYILWKFK